MAMKPNVLLVIPRYLSTAQYGYIIPMGIMYVSSALKNSGVANVFTLNLNHQEESDESVLRRVLAENSIDIVGTGGISGQFIEIGPLAALVRRIAPQVRIIVGGGMITADAIPAMEAFDGSVDVGMIGEGEITVPELVQALHRGSSLHKVDGLIFKENDEWVITDRRKDIMDLDTIAFPDYAGFDYDKYLEMNGEVIGGVKYSQVAVIGGRSCKYNCTFCFHPSGSKYRQRSLDNIFTEIDYLLANYNVNYIALREELFASDEGRVLDFCERMKNYPIVWSIQLRVDSVTPRMVKALSESKCRYVFLGIESADNGILKSMRKHITIEQVEYALDLANSAGLDTRSTLILGDSVETKETAYRTFNWWLEHKSVNSIDIGLIIAFPGSTLYKRARLNGRIPDPVQFLKDGCPIVNLSENMTDEEFDKLVADITARNQIHFNVHNYK